MRTLSIFRPVCSPRSQACALLPSRFLICSFLLLVLLAAVVSPAFATEDSKAVPEPKIPDVLILVLVNQQMDSVSFIYSKVVDRGQVERHLANLVRETGWTTENVRVDDIEAGGSPSTTVEFSTLGTVDLSSGGFPIEPIVKAFKDQSYIELQFMVNMPFEFRGLREFEDKHIKISLRRGTNVYGYTVFVKDPDFATLNLPLVQAETAPPKPGGGNHSGILTFVLIIVLGLLVAVLAFYLTKRASGTHSES